MQGSDKIIAKFAHFLGGLISCNFSAVLALYCAEIHYCVCYMVSINYSQPDNQQFHFDQNMYIEQNNYSIL